MEEWRGGGVARVSEEEVESRDDEGQEPSPFIHSRNHQISPVQVELIEPANRIQTEFAAPFFSVNT